ncbi:beta-ala-his dipeptidase [Holotrichia oblita]|uniref:Beta-ala-his dipeptidase n=1 Tax=Holotrichia oblita TaxID=644536 RepID=A0ACB9T3M8_HOLOL|nr:beta-ala-his dipeptidase [Holotrichia oblita]
MVYPHTYRTEHSETRTTNAEYGQYYAQSQSKKIKIQPQLLKILQYVDSNRVQIVQDLREAVKIQSTSDDLINKDNIINMVKFAEKWLLELGVKYECFNIGTREIKGKRYKLPPVILGNIGSDKEKKTLCIYSYLDVNKPEIEKWNTDPWTVTEINKCIYGNGVASGKGVLIMWFHVLAAFQAAKIPLPINIKFIIESMHTHRSEGLDEFLLTKKLDYLFDVDYVIACGSEWIGEKYPCIVYGGVEVEKSENSTSDVKKDLGRVFDALIDKKGKVTAPGFYDNVSQITPDEERLYEDIQDFDLDGIRDCLPPEKRNWNKVKLLMDFWRLPATKIFDMQEYRVVNIMTKHVKNICKDLNITNKVDLKVLSSTRPWLEDITSANYQAARRATIQIYKEDPNMIRDDTDNIVINIITRILEVNMLLLPLSTKSTNIGKENENIPLRNLYEGTKLLGAYLFQLNEIEQINS